MSRFKTILFLVFLSFSNSIFATHLVGGFISYQYIGPGASGVRYTVTITAYRDCKPGSVDLESDINLCIYNRATNKLEISEKMTITSRNKVLPIGRTDCPEAIKTCLERGIYRKTITLPNNTNGYILRYETCCRNVQVNLRDDGGVPILGQAYETIIPSTYIKNSSPSFTDVPVPFLCINDTTEANNYAVDPDGDSLVYRVATPWKNDPAFDRECPKDYTAPKVMELADYKTGFGSNIPFGTTGVFKINPKNGIATIHARQVGNYAVAIDLFEYRNGVLLGRVRLDLQVLVIECNINNQPRITNTKKHYDILAGDTLCFDVTATDSDMPKQMLSMKAFGDVFTGANGFIGNRATFTESSGQSPIMSRFCWKTDCNQWRDDSIFFTTLVFDDGCPSKYRYTNFSLRVLKPTINVSMSGLLNYCQNSVVTFNLNFNATYAKEITNPTFNYELTNCTFISRTANSITVKFSSSANNASIKITPINTFGCEGPPITRNINLSPSPPIPPVVSVDTVCLNSIKNYSFPSTAGNTYLWLINGANFLGASNNNQVQVQFPNLNDVRLRVLQRNSNNCVSDTATINIHVSKPGLPLFSGSTAVCPNNKNIEYVILNKVNSSSYVWSVSGGTLRKVTDSSCFVDWGNMGLGYVKLFAINKFGCLSDTNTLNVEKKHALVATPIFGDSNVCENTVNKIYRTTQINGYTYHWAVTGGIITSGQGTNRITVDWGTVGTGNVSMYQSSFDSVNNLPCLSNTLDYTVYIREYPSNNVIVGFDEFCQSNDSATFTAPGMPNSTYTWYINNNPNNISGQGTNTIKFSLKVANAFEIKVIEISQYNCVGQPIIKNIIINPRPITSRIIGDSVLCYPNFNNINYSVNGFPTSTFNWNVDSGNFIPNNNSVSISFLRLRDNRVSVVEISDKNCPGDSQNLDIWVDKPSLFLNFLTVNPPPSADNGISLYWTLLNAPRYNNQFFIERTNTGNSTFTVVGNVSNGTFDYNNSPINTDQNAFQYRIKGFDLCNNEIYSNIHQNIWLKGIKTGAYSVQLDFTPYQGWSNALINYDVYRQLKNKTPYELYTPNLSSTNISYDNGLEYYTQCYRIKGTKAGTDTVTWSNDICFNFDPLLFIPNAFSPNGDDENDNFGVVAGALSKFNFQIYNRWGEKIFESNDFKEKWDGTYRGEKCPQDVYVYYCFYKGFDGKDYSTKGTITLLR